MSAKSQDQSAIGGRVADYVLEALQGQDPQPLSVGRGEAGCGGQGSSVVREAGCQTVSGGRGHLSSGDGEEGGVRGRGGHLSSGDGEERVMRVTWVGRDELECRKAEDRRERMDREPREWKEC